MTRFISNKLDLTRLQGISPALILGLAIDPIVAARLADLQARLPDIDILGMATDPLVRLQYTDAYRELLDKGLLNDTVRGLLAAFATGTDLDHVVARAGITRLVITPATDIAAAVMEDDDTLRMRYFASFGAPAAGSEDGYIFTALTAYPGAQDIQIVGPGVHGVPGRVDVVVLAPGGAAVAPATLSAIVKAVTAENARPLTDIVSVLSGTIVPYAASLTVRLRRGPDPAAARSAVLASAQAIVSERYRIGGQVPRNALAAAGYPIGVEAIVSAPAADIPPDPYSAPWCTGIDVTVQEID